MSASTSLSTALSHPATVPPQTDNERRSSSLSDVGERIEQDELDSMNIDTEDKDDANDTEAETERLDDSPVKRREHRNVVLASATAEDSDITHPTIEISHRQRSQSLSEASSPPETSEDDSRSQNTSVSPKKRKRSIEDDISEAEADPAQSPQRRKSTPGSSVSRKSLSYPRQRSGGNSVSSRASSLGEIGETIKETDLPPRSNSSTRSDKQVSDDEVDVLEDTVDLQDNQENLHETAAIESNAEEMDADDNADADLENASKNQEEVAKKRSALDSLSALEKCFATLRDRLFDERLAAANEELSLLQKPDFVHPELLAMKEAIDRHRQQKEKYQQTYLKYKLETLQRESVATKHQIQSQYMQTIRELRDKSLDNLNKEFYQVQRERRNGDNDVPDAMYFFTNDRAQQVRQQTAYNTEVSILAGVAKYKGFPAAPVLRSVNSGELEEDLRNMGIATRSSQPWQNRHTSLRNEAPGPSPLNRQVSSAEEVFLERNAWANPHHPAHQHRFSRQASNPNPAATKKNHQQEAINTNGSGSTPPSGFAAGTLTNLPAQMSQNRASITQLSRPNNTHLEARQPNREHETASLSDLRPSATATHEHQTSSSLVWSNANHEGSMPSKAQNLVPATQSNGIRVSSPIRLPLKMEDAPASRPSPVSRKFGSPADAITAGNGQAR